MKNVGRSVIWKDRELFKKHIQEYRKEYRKTRILKMKLEVLLHYSNNLLKCAKCGYSENMKALCIDHINAGDNMERTKIGNEYSFYLWLIRNNYPEGYQVLCANCNQIKAYEEKGIKNNCQKSKIDNVTPGLLRKYAPCYKI